MTTLGSPHGSRLVVMSGVLLMLTVLASLVPGAYVVYTPGPVVDVLGETEDEDGASVEFIEVIGGQAYHDGGKLEMTTVYVTNPENSEWPGAVAWAWFSPESALLPREWVYPTDTTNDDEDAQSAAEMAASQDSARVVAMRAAGLTVPTTITVVEVADGMPADGVLEVDDVLVSANGAPLDSLGSLLTAIGETPPDEKLTLEIRRDGAPLTVKLTPKREDDGSQRVGISPREEFDLPVTVEINIPENIGGPSAGLMFSLAIYDTLTEGSLTQGDVFAGTGEIFSDGQVGPIGGIQQKIAAARESGAVLFFVPVDNCPEAVGAVNGTMRLVRVSTMQDALDAIEQWHDNPGAELARCEP